MKSLPSLIPRINAPSHHAPSTGFSSLSLSLSLKNSTLFLISMIELRQWALPFLLRFHLKNTYRKHPSFVEKVREDRSWTQTRAYLTTCKSILELKDKGAELVFENNPYVCLDLSFINSLLVKGYSVPETQKIKLAKKIKGYETGWCMGAMMKILDEHPTCVWGKKKKRKKKKRNNNDDDCSVPSFLFHFHFTSVLGFSLVFSLPDSEEVKGNRIKSLMVGVDVKSMQSRSIPIPQPAVGGNPYSRASQNSSSSSCASASPWSRSWFLIIWFGLVWFGFFLFPFLFFFQGANVERLTLACWANLSLCSKGSLSSE